MEKIVLSLENFLEQILLALPRYAVGILVIIIGIYVIKGVVGIIGRRFEKRDLDKSLRGFLLSMIRIMLYIVLFVVVSGIMGFKSMSFTAIFGAAGLTIGLALQGSLSNFAGGVLILMFKPFKVGDYISNTGSTEGTVERIDLLYTTLTTAAGLKVFSPNGALANSVITNYSEITARRYDFVVGISYSANIKEAREVILAALDKHESIQKDPKPIVFVNGLADSSVNLNVRTWMAKEDYWSTVFEIQQLVKVALDEANIEIPFPQTDLHIISDNTK
ncbi:mechanosensitive ion channel family protein [Myroides phaeus]|uniref:Small conductance mechanosensitive channel n=1 Tax=Myroides phaeus TaxID=702745 RepID=A0A1G8FGG0_9FLAO|nr:mechanosensitive ion channel family protein [Myroides phaeus]MEC4115375.1 mechanosensitive ion channel family protein [Myroides phaeus]SDH81089.1 small conductance mechanosensitive channel [Myroides phaeus]